MGIIAFIKMLAPLTLYGLAIVLMMCAMLGKVRWALVQVVLLLPLRNVVEKLQDFPAGNQLIDLLLMSMIVGWVVTTVLNRKSMFAPTYLNISISFMIIYMSFSMLLGNNFLHGSMLSIDLGESRVQDWKNFCLFPLLFFITVNNIQDKVWVRRIFLTICFTMVIMNYYLTSQINDYSSLVSRNKIHGTFEFLGPNEVAAFYNEYTIILMAIYFSMKRSLGKWLLLALIYVNVYCILFLFSRGAYLGFSAGMAILFAIKNKKFLIPLILVLVFWQAVLPDKVIQRIKGTTDEYGQLDESAGTRVLIWREGMELFRENSLMGVGFGVFRHLGFSLGDTHNIYVKLLIEQGIVGLLIFLVVILCFVRIGWMLYQKGDDDFSKGLGLGLAVCMVVVLVNNFFGDRWTYFEMSGYLWVFAGLAARLILLSGRNDTSPKPIKRRSALTDRSQ